MPGTLRALATRAVAAGIFIEVWRDELVPMLQTIAPDPALLARSSSALAETGARRRRGWRVTASRATRYWRALVRSEFSRKSRAPAMECLVSCPFQNALHQIVTVQRR